jgi:hypothetical protein
MASDNSFFGMEAAFNNTMGNNNAFFGRAAGFNNSTGSNNTFVGRLAGLSNTTESNNTFLGANANGAAGITNATSVGANAVVTQSNSVVLGNNASVGIGSSAPKAKLHIEGGNVFVGGAGQGIILKSPDGATCRLLRIDNSGAMEIVVVACP